MQDITSIEHIIYPISETSHASEHATAEYTPRIAGAPTTFFFRSSKHGTILYRNTLQQSISLSLEDLRDDHYYIQRPIPITLRLTDSDDFIAIVDQTTIAMTGSSAIEAIRLLREHIGAVYDILNKQSLGPELQRQRRILEAYIAEKPATATGSQKNRKEARRRDTRQR